MDNHTSTSTPSFFTGRMLFLVPNQLENWSGFFADWIIFHVTHPTVAVAVKGSGCYCKYCRQKCSRLTAASQQDLVVHDHLASSAFSWWF